jgi:hypothetical protein
MIFIQNLTIMVSLLGGICPEVREYKASDTVTTELSVNRVQYEVLAEGLLVMYA